MIRITAKTYRQWDFELLYISVEYILFKSVLSPKSGGGVSSNAVSGGQSIVFVSGGNLQATLR